MLHYECLGSPDHWPLVMVHGLFGSWQNLKALAQSLSSDYYVVAVDCRNHGQSFHDNTMTYDDMAVDVMTLMTQRIQRSVFGIIGHSMGGKVAMQTALMFPDAITAIAVMDIAPKAYPPYHQPIIQAMRSLDLRQCHTVTDAITALAPAIPNAHLRQFLAKNLTRKNGALAWKINLSAIDGAYKTIASFPSHTTSYHGPSLFIRGSRSNYIDDNDPSIFHHMPRAVIEDVDASHWIHAEQPTTVSDRLMNWFKSVRDAP